MTAFCVAGVAASLARGTLARPMVRGEEVAPAPEL